MKKVVAVSLCFLLFFMTSCIDLSGQNSDEFDLDKLIAAFDLPEQSLENVNFDEQDDDFPIELINKIKTSLVIDELESLVKQLNDENLVVEFESIEEQLHLETEDPKRLYNLLYSESPTRDHTEAVFYRLDVNNDGKEELFVVEKNKDPIPPMIHVLSEENGQYTYLTSLGLYYESSCGIFLYEDVYYFITSKYDYGTGATAGAELYILDNAVLEVGKNDNLYKSGVKFVNVKRVIEDFDFTLLYGNDRHPLTNPAISYVDTIAADLMYTEKMYYSFNGDEVLEWESLYLKYENHENYHSSESLLSADVDNDGENEIFVKYKNGLYHSYPAYPETTLVWRDPESLQEYDLDIHFWESTDYMATQRWFKKIDEKYVSFSLYRKPETDIYILDARIHDNEKTTVLVDYVIYPMNTASIFDSLTGITDNTTVKTYHSTPVVELVPDFQSKVIDYSNDVKGEFFSESYPGEEIPADLVMLLEKALYEGNFEDLYDLSSQLEVDKEKFYQSFSSTDDIIFHSRELYEERVDSVFSYNLDKTLYYLVTQNQKPGCENIFIYICEDGQLVLHDKWMTENMDRVVIPFQDRYYLIEKFQLPYLRSQKEFSDRLFVVELSSSKITEYLVLSFIPDKFNWQKVYSLKESSEQEMNDYVKSIKKQVTEGVYVDRETRFYQRQSTTFTGEETADFDKNMLSRLLSITGFVTRNHHYHQFYESDYDNDGIPNYINRYHVGYHLCCNFYDVSEEKIIKTETNLIDNQANGEVIQIWFKEIGGKVFTFKLYWLNEFNFYLTVSLIEEDIEAVHQVYIIAPSRQYDFYKFPVDSYFK